MAGKSHVIWGEIEQNTVSSSTDKSLDEDLHTSGAGVRRRLPPEVVRHLEQVHFRDDTQSSTSGSQGAVERSPNQGRAQSVQAAQGSTYIPSGAASPELSELWSVGSALHGEGKCRPCHYSHMEGGCFKGRDCEFCHLPHRWKFRPRPSKTKRQECKRIVGLLDRVADKDSDQFAEMVSELSSKSLYLKALVQKCLAQPGQNEEAPSGAQVPAAESASPVSLEECRAAARKLLSL